MSVKYYTRLRSHHVRTSHSTTIMDDNQFFDSLDDLKEYCLKPRSTRPRNNPPTIPYLKGPTTATANNKPRFLVCHDYKGGYTEQSHQRDYTFHWWHLTDIFIYFSHHRVTVPPASWIRAAHRNGTKVLGLLIFEWDQGKKEIIDLVLVEPLQKAKAKGHEAFAVLDTGYADLLVDLAIERGFEGPVNAPPVIDSHPMEWEKVSMPRHSSLGWNTSNVRRAGEYLTEKPSGKYDAVTTEGELQWQSALTSRNERFFAASDGLFTDYHWRPTSLERTVQQISQNHSSTTTSSVGRPSRQNDVFFGIDVFGRGQFGGGGFESWRAMEAIRSTTPSGATQPIDLWSNSPSPLASSTSQSSQFSIALFAPGWTAEASELDHTLSTRDGYRRWFADERYLWIGGVDEPAGLAADRRRLDKIRKEERGLARARALAVAIGQRRRTPLAPFDYDAPLPPLPGGKFRSLSSFLDARPAPCFQGVWYTNFSSGSGHSFFVEGKEYLRTEKGWTHVDHTFPAPALLFAAAAEDRSIGFDFWEDDAWLGSRSLRITTSSAREIDLAETSLALSTEFALVAQVVWKPLSSGSKLDVLIKDSRPTTSVTYTLANGWFITWARFHLQLPISPTTRPIPSSTSVLGVSLSNQTGSQGISVLIGSLTIARGSRILLPQPFPADFALDRTTGTLSWKVVRTNPGPAPVQFLDGDISPGRQEWPEYLFYAIFLIIVPSSDGGAGEDAAVGGEGETERRRLVGTTFATQFRLSEEVLQSKGTLVCVGVKDDGAVEPLERCPLIQLG
ncbi:hypothetical protein T439DRAFT_358826 [Meredithblackwellia eburnea MCA 4105]